MPPCAYSYPESPPIECIQEIVRILKSRSVAEERAAFLKHAWVVQGYLQSKLLGEPEPVVIGGILDCDDDKMIGYLLDLTKVAVPVEPAAPQALPIPVKLLVRWLLSRLVDELLERR